MNILHIAPYFPSIYATHAGGVCMGKEIEELEKSNSVYSLSFIQKIYDRDIFLKTNKKNYEVVNLSRINKIISIILHPLIAPLFATRTSRNFYNKMIKIINEKKIDAIHAEYAAMAQYVKIKKKYPKLEFNIVLHDVTLQSYLRKTSLENNKIKKIFLGYICKIIKFNEKKWLSKSNNILVFTQKDKQLIYEYYGLTNIKIINTEFGIERKLNYSYITRNKKDEIFNIVFLGQMSRIENSEAAKRLIAIYKKFLSKNTSIRIHIIGNNPSKELVNNVNQNIIVTGFIEDIDQYLVTHADLAVFPLNFGAGIKVKVLHCMALGIPIITNNVGAEGIDESGKYIQLAVTDEDFANKINDMFDCFIDPTTIAKMREFVFTVFSWQKTVQVFKEIYNY